MANKVKGEIEIELCGKKYTLRPEFEGMLEAEDKIGKPLPVVFFEWGQRLPSLREVVSVVYGGLLYDKDVRGRPLTFEEVGKRVQETGFATFRIPVMQIVRNLLVPQKDEEEDAPAKKKKGPKASSQDQPHGSPT